MFTVLGAGGFIGRAVADRLTRMGQEVLTPRRGEEVSPGVALGTVIYCIGLTSDFRTRPHETMHAHVSLLSEVIAHNTFDSILYLSSTRVYSRSRIGREDASLSVDPRNPSDLYNLSKLAGEALVLGLEPGRGRVARLSNVVGANPMSGDFFFDICRQALNGRIRLRSALESSKDYLGLDDAVTMLVKIAGGGRHSCYNVAAGVSLSNRELTDRIAELTKCEIVVDADAPLLQFPRIDTSLVDDEFHISRKSVLDRLPEYLNAVAQEE